MNHRISGSTSVCIVIGDPISHSLSPIMHNAAYAALDLPFVMVAARVSSEELADALRGVRALGIKGVACTMPHKADSIPLIDELDPIAATIGAVNTVVVNEKRLIGYNTDYLGILRPLEKLVSLQNTPVAVLGAGGAAQAAVYACASRGASVTICNRTPEHAAELAERFRDFQVKTLPLNSGLDLSPYKIIINATSLGMAPEPQRSPLDPSQLSEYQVVFETIYHPLETQLLRDAKAKGAQVIHGLEMFLEQGAAQFELHTSVKAPREVMKTILESALPS